MTSALVDTIERLVKTAQEGSAYVVKVVCAKRTSTFGFDDYDNALSEALAWYGSGYAGKIDIVDDTGKMLFTFCRNIAFFEEPAHVPG